MDITKLKLLARFCSVAYVKKIEDLKNIANKISGSWKLFSTSDETHGANDMYYRSYAMVNEGSKEVLVVNSGTRMNQLKQVEKKGLIHDIIADAEVFLKQVPSQFTEDGEVFLKHILQTHAGYSFILTGHSLGAVFAQLSHTYLEAHGVNSTSFVFESPGSFDTIEGYIKDNHLNVSIKEVIQDSKVINAAPNLINSLHKQVGSVYRIQEKEAEECTVTKALYDFFVDSVLPKTVEQEKMLKLVERLDLAFNTFESHGIDYIVNNLEIPPVLEREEEFILFARIQDLFSSWHNEI